MTTTMVLSAMPFFPQSQSSASSSQSSSSVIASSQSTSSSPSQSSSPVFIPSPSAAPLYIPSQTSGKVAGLCLLAEAAMNPLPILPEQPQQQQQKTNPSPPAARGRRRAASPPSRTPSPSLSPPPSPLSYSPSPASSCNRNDPAEPAATTASSVSLAAAADSSLSSPSSLRQHISSLPSPIFSPSHNPIPAASTTSSSSSVHSPVPRNVFYFVEPSKTENQPLSVLSAQLQGFLQSCIKSTWGFRYQICRFPLFDDIISCVLWEGRYFITGTDIVKYVAWRFRLEGLAFGEQKKFEEGIFSDLRNLKPGTDSVLEEPRSRFLEFLFKAGCVRTHKKQKVFFWTSVPFDRLFQEAVRREKRRDINPVLNSLLSLKSSRDSEDEAHSPQPSKKARILAPAAAPAAATPAAPHRSNTAFSALAAVPHLLPSFNDGASQANSAFLPPLGLALSGLLNLKDAGSQNSRFQHHESS